jgi:molecular chaperone GrpE
MISWTLVILGIVAISSIGWALWERHRRRRVRRQLEDETERLRREATARIQRLERQVETARQTGHLDFAEDLMEAVDTLERARSELANSEAPQLASSLVEGLDMVERNLVQAFRRHGLDPIAPESGDPFDPEKHEAWSTREVSSEGRNLICEVHRRGWAFGERIVRPAAVTVGKSEEVVLDDPVPDTEQEDETDQQKATAD